MLFNSRWPALILMYYARKMKQSKWIGILRLQEKRKKKAE